MAAARFSYRNATVLVCVLNLFLAAFLLRSRVAIALSRSPHTRGLSSAQLKYIWESELMRRAMEPVDLIKRVKEIEEEFHAGMEMTTQEDPKQTAAVDLSKRLKDFRATNDANSQKALEEWRKRKMDRARQREVERNSTSSRV